MPPVPDAKRIGIAVVGVGRWGPNVLRAFSDDPRCEVRLVVDRSPERLSQVAARYPGVQLASDIAAVVGDDSIDAAAVATPASTHFDIAAAVLRAGKHCMVEKPLTTDSKSAVELVAIAAAEKLILAVGHVFVHNPAIRRAKELVDQGHLGTLRYLSMVRTNLGPAGIDVNVAWDLAAHDISVANYLLDASAISASARGGKWISLDREDTLFATLTYPGKRLVHINASWLSPRKVRDIIIVGSARMLTIDDMNINEPIRVLDKGVDIDDASAFVDSFGDFRSSVRDGDIHIPRVAIGEPLRLECNNFIESIILNKPPITDGASAVPVIRTIEAINRSMAGTGGDEPVEG